MMKKKYIPPMFKILAGLIFVDLLQSGSNSVLSGQQTDWLNYSSDWLIFLGDSCLFINLYGNVLAMKLFTDFLLSLSIGLVLYFILYAWRGRFPFAFRAFFIFGPATLAAFYILGLIQSEGVTLPGWTETTLGWAVQASSVILGYCLGSMMGGVDRHYSYIIRGLSIQIGITFVAFSIGKSLNMPYMKHFFLSSGYSVSFLYFIIVLEGVNGMVLLFNLKLYPKIITLVILSTIIIGAIVTHARNGDPIGDSVDAILLSTKIVILVAVYFLYKRYLHKEALSSGVSDQ